MSLLKLNIIESKNCSLSLKGMQNRFSPEQLGIISSSALAYSIFELIIYSIVLYVTNISTSMKTLDLLAFSGYKFPVIVACISISIIFKRVGYYSTLIYSSFTLFFFLVSKSLNSFKYQYEMMKISFIHSISSER